MFGHLDIVKILLNAGADSTLLNRDGDSPYQVAVKCQQPHISDYLRTLKLSSTPKKSIMPSASSSPVREIF